MKDEVVMSENKYHMVPASLQNSRAAELISPVSILLYCLGFPRTDVAGQKMTMPVK